MYDNIGDKIKNIALCITIIISLGAIIGGIVFIANGNDYVGGILMIILGPIIAWLLSIPLYGFGELIEKVSEIERKTCGDISDQNDHGHSDYEKLKKLDELLAQGQITEEQYKKMLVQIINR